MVTQQEFIQGLLEPLATGMKPLALADAPGAVVRGMASGQSLSEAFSSVDPLSMEGRVHGEDITGNPISGLIFDLLSDPATIAGMGTAGLGMALSRRAFLKRAGQAAAAAGLPGGEFLAGAIKGGPQRAVSDRAVDLLEKHKKLWKTWDRVESQGLLDAEFLVHAMKDSSEKERQRELRKLVLEDDEVQILRKIAGVETELLNEGWAVKLDDTAPKQPGSAQGYFLEGHKLVDLYGLQDPAGKYAEAIKKIGADLHEETYGVAQIMRDAYSDELASLSSKMARKASKKARKRIRKGDYRSMPPGRGPRSGLSDIRPADYILLERLIREMSQQAPGGRYGY